MRKYILLLLAIVTSSISYGQVTITHSNSQIVSGGNGITCAFSGGVVSDNSYYAVFILEDDFEITEDWQIMAVEIGIEDANDLLDGQFPIIISAFTTDDNTPNGNLELLGSETLFITSEDELSVVSLEFPPSVIVPAGETLVIKIEVVGDGQSVFRMGSTHVPANDESWGQAPSCDFPIPITYTEAGFENVWNIINVVGDVPTGLNEALSQSVSIYPNPTSEMLQIQEGINILNMHLFDLRGNVQSAPITNRTMDLSLLANGVYLLEMHTDKGIVRKRIIKE